MSERDPRAADLLRAYRREASRPAEAREALWARIEGSVAAERDLGTPAPRRRVAALLVVLGMTAGATLVVGLTRLPSPPAQAPSVVAPEPEQPVPLAPRTSRPLPASQPPASPPPPSLPSAAQPRTPRPAPPEAASPADTLPEELRLIRQAKRDLRGQDPQRALETLATYQQRFPDGQMREDGSALRIEALCAADKHPQARAELLGFAERFPASAHLVRLRTRCASQSIPR